MKTRVIFSAIILLIFSFAVYAQQSETEKQITETVLNYAEGWYEGDAARMESALLPELAKRRIEPAGQGGNRVSELSSLGLVQMTRTGYGKNTPKEEQKKDVKILDIFNDTATVRLEMRDWVDYMHLAKYNGKWLIVNVLWDLKPRTGNGSN